ncbi:hypothetical protein LCGC14_2912410 [marine sediment metagenome]|uniref:Uncharacterized protein n=1 Tax=marine sediment metagenome TaxID=412755 RepID=A0A0F8XR96_9ZZZZ
MTTLDEMRQQEDDITEVFREASLEQVMRYYAIADKANQGGAYDSAQLAVERAGQVAITVFNANLKVMQIRFERESAMSRHDHRAALNLDDDDSDGDALDGDETVPR